MEETIMKTKFQKRAINLSEMPSVVLQEIFKNVHPQSALKMMRANKSWNAFVSRNRRHWRKISMTVNVAFERLLDGRVAYTIVLTPDNANLKYTIKMEEALSGTPITPDEDIFIQQELKANVADPMGQLLKIMKTVLDVVRITQLVLNRMPDKVTLAFTSIFDKNTIESVSKFNNSCCPSTLQQFVGSLSCTERIRLFVPREAITADLFKLPQIQNANMLAFAELPDYLPLGDADLLALKTGFLCFECHSDITQRYFRTFVQEFMLYKRNFENCEHYTIYYKGIIAPEQVFDSFVYSVINHNQRQKIFKYEVKRSDNLKLVVGSIGYIHYMCVVPS